MEPQWTHRNLAIQGYRLSASQAGRLAIGLRFSTGLCLPLVAVAVALGSAPAVFALTGVAMVAGFGPRHPFDEVWNHVVRHAVGAPELPPTPRLRRHAFKFGAACLLGVGVLLDAGRPTAALALGATLTGFCTVVTLTNFCIPSTALCWFEGLRAPQPKEKS